MSVCFLRVVSLWVLGFFLCFGIIGGEDFEIEIDFEKLLVLIFIL